MARRIWGKRQGADGKQHMGRLQQTLALLAVLGAGVAIAALLGGSGYALTLVTGGTTDTTPRSLQAAGPTIESDQPDYNPGATVVLTGHNWADSEAVHVAVNDDKGQTWSYSDDVTADANGDFSLHFVLPTSFVATYAAVATGAMSGTARTTFTDGNVKWATQPNNANVTETVFSAATNCTGTVKNGFPTTKNGSDTVGVGNNESLRLDAAATDATGNPFENWDASTTANPYTLISGTGGRSICIASFQNGTQSYQANYDRPPTITRSGAAAITINEGSPTSNNGSYSDPDTGDSVTISASVGTVTKSGTNSGTWSWSYTPPDGVVPPATQTVTISADDGTATPATTSFTLTVNNVAPIATAAGNQTATEGDNKSFSIGSFSDPGADSPWTVDIDWGDGSTHTNFTQTTTGAIAAQSHTYADNRVTPYTVSVKVTDKDGGTDTKTFTVAVSNVAPTLTAPANQNANEGASTSFNLGSFSDPGANDTPWAIDVDWGDGSAHTSFNETSRGTITAKNHTYADGPATRTVTVKVTDKDGGVDTKTFTVAVANVAPSVTAAANQNASEGSASSFTLGSFSDPGTSDNPWSVDVNWGDGSTHSTFSQATQGSLGSQSHNYDDSGTYTVTVKVTDKDNGAGSATFQVTVTNVAPTATLSNNGPVNEGSPVTVSFSGQSDPSGADTTAGFHYAYACDNSSLVGSTYAGSSASASTSCTFSDNGTKTVRARIIDKDGGSTEYTTNVTVNNVNPTVTVSDQMAIEGTPDSFHLGSFSDPGSGDNPWKVHVDWGDGTSSNLPDFASQGSLGDAGHTYADGLHDYTVTVTVTDKDGGAGTGSFKVTVVNAPPVVTAPANQNADEGSNPSFSLGSFTDKGANDHPWVIDVNWGDGHTNSYSQDTQGAITAESHQYDDGPNTYTVTVKVTDKDGGVDSKTFQVIVANVAPTATISNDGPTSEGSNATITFANQSDPSSADTTAGFHYAYACDGNAASLPTTYAGALMGASATCLFPDGPASHPVVARIFDKDGGYTDHPTTVTVSNADPQVTAPADQNANEGTSKSFNLGSFNDAGVNDAPWTIYVQWGDGHSDSYSQGTQGAVAAESHTYADNGSYTVSVNVMDKDGGNSTKTFKITVANLAPVVAGQFDQSSNEGQNASFDLGSFSDAGVNDAPWKVSVDWGDGNTSTLADTSTQGALGNAAHTYADNGTYTATVRVKDKDGDTSQNTFHVTVANLAPVVTAATNQNAIEGTSTSFSLGSFTDAGINDTPWVVDVDWGDGSSHTGFNASSQGTIAAQSHSYVDNGPYTVTVKVTDKDGAHTSASFQVSVANANPVVTAAATQNSTEGTSANFALGSSSDLGVNDGPWAIDVNWGDTTHTLFNSTTQGDLGTKPHSYVDNGTYTVTVKVTDKDGGYSTASFQITIANANPVVTQAAAQTGTEGTPKSFDLGSFSDLGVNDGPWGVSVNWGDGSTNSAFMAPAQGLLGTQSHTYADNGDYTVTVSVTDKDGGSGSATFHILVANANPVVTSGGNQSSDEGAAHDFTLGSFSDLGAGDGPWSVDVDWGDGSAHSTGPRTSQGGLGTSSHTYDDNGSYTVTVTVTDKDGGSGHASFTATVANVAPTATLSNDGPVNEASPATISFSAQSDLSSADTSAGFHYAYACDDGSLAGATYGGSSGDVSHQCTFDDGPSTHTVRARIIDKDGGYSEYETTVSVANVAPTATLTNDGPVDEGSQATISFSDQLDPSSADTTAGFHYAYSCSNGDLSGKTYATSGSSASYPCTFNDNGTYTVKARIIDKDNGFTEYTTDVTVNNVAPTLTAAAGQSSDEGASHSFDLGSFSDPGADSPWKVHVDWGDGHSSDPTDKTARGALGSADHTYDDNGSYPVTVTVTDKDGASGSAQFTATVANVAPTATVSNDGPVVEGSAATISFANQHDPSGADTTAGFHYTYACDGYVSSLATTYAAAGMGLSATCTYPDGPSSHLVKARIFDKDGGYTTYSTTVAVTNANPVVTAAADQTADEGTTKSFDLGSFADAGANDNPWNVHVGWGDGSSSDPADRASQGTLGNASHAYADNGTYTVTVTVTDKDGASGSASFSVTVANLAPVVTAAASQAADEGTSKSFSLGSFNDSGAGDNPWSVDVEWGDGSANTTFTTSTRGALAAHSHSYADNGTYTVTVTVTDKDGAAGSASSTVTVANLAPVVTAAAGQASDEGVLHSFSLGSFNDAGPGDGPWGVSVNWGDGSAASSFFQGSQGSLGSLDHKYADNGTYTVTVTVTDKDGGAGSDTYQVTVHNLPPVVTAAADQTADEGTSKSFSLGSFSDPGANDNPWKVHVGWGDGSSSDPADRASQGTLGNASHAYADNGTYTVTATVTDKDGASGSASFTVTVANVAPAATVSNDGPVAEGSPATISFSAQHDPSSTDTASGFHYSYACDGNLASLATTYATAGMGVSATCTYPDGPSNHLVKARIFDKDDGYSTYDTTIVVTNAKPVVAAAADQLATEGASTSFSLGSFSDAGVNDSPWAVDVNWGDGSTHTAFSATAQGSLGSQSHTYVDNGSYAVTVRVTDKDGGYSSAIFHTTVANASPSVTPPSNQSGDEGTSKSFSLGFFSDPGINDSPWAVEVNWGDGSAHTTFNAASQGLIGSQPHTYADNATYTVTVKVTDKDGGSGQTTFTITVANVSPMLTPPANQAANEGASTSFNLGSFTDPGADNPWSVDVGWGDGSPHTTFTRTATGSLGSQTHTYADNGPYTVMVTVTDKDGASGWIAFTVTVANANPVVVAAADQTATEGTAKNFNLGSFSDAGLNDNPWAADIDWGDGSAHTTLSQGTQGSLGMQTHTYADNGTYTVTVKVTDKDAGSGQATSKVTVANAPPVVTAPADQAANEGASTSFSLGSFSDLGANDTPWAVDVDWGDSSTHTTFSKPAQGALGSQPHTYADNGSAPYTVTVKVTDKDGGYSQATFKVTVSNVAPTITTFMGTTSLTGPLVFVPATFNGTFKDPGLIDNPWAVAWSWDGGPVEAGSSVGANGTDTHSFGPQTHQYTTASCSHTATVKITDKDGGSNAGSTQTITVGVGSGAFLPPMTNQPVTNKLKNGQVLPVKIQLTDCGGAPINGLTPAIRLVSGDQTTTFDDSSVQITPPSVSNADTTGQMRSSGTDGSYIYNMNINIPLNTDYTVVIYPYWTTGTPAGVTLRHVIQATK